MVFSINAGLLGDMMYKSFSAWWNKAAPRVRKGAPVAILLVMIAGVCVASIAYKTPSFDEGTSFFYGSKLISKLDSDRFDDSKMPVSALNAVPWALGRLIHRMFGVDLAFLSHYNVARLVTIAFSILAAALVFHWTRRLYGYHAGLLALALYAFSPNIIAHGRLITTDLFVLLAILAATYFFWRFLSHPDWKNCAISALCFGLAQIAKYSAVFLVPIFFIVFVVRVLARNRSASVADSEAQPSPPSAKTWAAWIALHALAALVIVNVAFLFNGTGTPLNGYHFESDFFKNLQRYAGSIGDIPIPLPYPYVQGLDLVKFSDATNRYFGRVYLLEELAPPGKGFPSYFLVAYLFKTPLPTQILVIAALVSLVRRWDWKRFLDNELFLLTPVAVYCFVMSFMLHAQMGIRLLLVVYPFLFILAGALLRNGRGALGKPRRIFVSLALVWLAASSLSYFPHYESYFNELLLDRKQAYRILADSNVDMGMDSVWLKEYASQHPQVIYSPSSPVAGEILVRVNDLVGVTANPEKFRWLRENFEPVGCVAYSILVFRVTPDDLRDLRRLQSHRKGNPQPRPTSPTPGG